MSWLDTIKRHTIYKQFLPTDEDLSNEELKNLAQRLKTDSQEKNLINILEWQDRNIKTWSERWTTASILTNLTIIALFVISIYFGKINHYLYFLLLFIPFIILGNLTLNIIFNLIIFLVSVLIIPLVLSTFSPVLNINSSIFLVLIAFSVVLGSFISLVIDLFLKYRGLKSYIPDFDISDTFKLSLPIKKILHYKLAICRDYAKLTSALILTLHPKSEIYFVLIPQHVAVCIKLNNKMYVLDQKLPILTLDIWKEKWKKQLKKKKLKIDLVKIYLENKKIRCKSVKNDEVLYQHNEINIDELNNKIKKLFKINIDRPKKKDNLKIPIKDFVLLISNDEIVKNSLIELIKNRVEDELVTNINNLKYIDAERKDKDLIIKVWLK